MTARPLLPLLLIVVGCVAQVLAQSPPADHYLDLLSYLHTPRSPSEPSPPLSLPGADIDFTSPATSDAKVELTLASLEGRDFAWGDECVYEVLVKNVGAEPVSFPWTPDASLLPEGERTALGAVALEIATSADATPVSLRLQPLFGSRSVAGTMIALEPGQSALIRARGTFSAGAGTIDDLVPDLSASISVKARLDLYGEGLLAISSNAIDATLSRPGR